MTKLDYFYNEVRLINLASYENLTNGKKRFFWDGVNGDKWQVLKRYGCPVTFIEVKNLSQGHTTLYQVADTKGNNSFPLVSE